MTTETTLINKKQPHNGSGTRRFGLVTLAACLALGASSCATTAPANATAPKDGAQASAEFAANKRQSAPRGRGRGRSSEGMPVVDTALACVSVPLGAVGWVLGNSFMILGTIAAGAAH